MWINQYIVNGYLRQMVIVLAFYYYYYYNKINKRKGYFVLRDFSS
jgi:hypothetical protein